MLNMTSASAESRERFVLGHALADDGLVVLSFTSPEFLHEVQGLLDSEIYTEATKSTFLPYSLVIINHTGNYIWGFTVIYTYPDQLSPSGRPITHQIFPSAKSNIRNDMLAPGGKYLITPLSGFISSRRPDGRRSAVPDMNYKDIINKWDQTNLERGALRIKASIDCVICEDGMLIGPDTAEKLSIVNNKIVALRQLAHQLEGITHGKMANRLKTLKQVSEKQSNNSQVKFEVQSAIEFLQFHMSNNTQEAVVERIKLLGRWVTSKDGLVHRNESSPSRTSLAPLLPGPPNTGPA